MFHTSEDLNEMIFFECQRPFKETITKSYIESEFELLDRKLWEMYLPLK